MAIDPRLAEIDFLTQVDRAADFTIHPSLPPEKCFGLSARSFYEMAQQLLLDGHLSGPAVDPSVPGTVRADIALSESRQLYCILKGAVAHVRLTHRGRVRIAELRDSLVRGRERDPFGILLNQRYCERDLRVRLLDASAETPLCVVMLDVDNFKKVNDRDGHPAGTEVLKRIFSLCQEFLGEDGDVYRAGGDEVLALLPGQPLNAAHGACEKLRATVEGAFKSMPQPSPTISVGLVEFSGPVNSEVAYKLVDETQYQAKHGGKNAVARGKHP